MNEFVSKRVKVRQTSQDTSKRINMRQMLYNVSKHVTTCYLVMVNKYVTHEISETWQHILQNKVCFSVLNNVCCSIFSVLSSLIFKLPSFINLKVLNNHLRKSIQITVLNMNGL